MTDREDVVSWSADIDQAFDDLVCEVSGKLEAGEVVDLDAIESQNPDHAGRILRLLPTLKAMATLGERAVTLDPPDDSRLADRTLGDFRIVDEIGRGGMGVVYEAEQLSLGRRVALKILPLAATLSARQMQRFKNEARAAATLKHPHIVGVYSTGVERGVHYYAMEYIEGCTLADAVRERRQAETGSAAPEPSGVAAQGLAASPRSGAIDTRPMAALSTIRTTDPEEYFRHAARLIADAAEALDYAHGRGIIHRDIKPANLLIDADSQVWVADFGLALLESDVGVTMSGDLLGTLRYMSPEQISPTKKVVDERTDVYSLGATLFELVTGRPLFGQTDRAELIRQIAAGQPLGLRQRATQLPVDLKTIIAKAVERDPADRYQSAQHMADDLRRFLDNRPILARPPSLINRLMKWSRRHVQAVWAALAASLLIAALSAGGTVLIARSSQEAHRQRQVAIDEKQEAQRNLYRANVQIAHYEWDDGRVDRTLDLLDAVRPSRGGTDYRCWEWYYVKSLCQRGESIDGWLIDSVPSCPVRLICRLNGDTRTFLDWKSGEVRLTLVAGLDDLHSVLGPAGRRLACAIDPPGANDASNWLRVYDLASRSRTWEKRVTPVVTELDWSPGGDRIVTAHDGGRVSVWDANNGSLIKKMASDAGCSGFENVKWSPDGRWIAVGHGIWDAASGVQVFRRITESDAYRAASGRVLDWHPSEQRLATVNREQLSVWDLDAAEPLLRFRPHGGWVQSVAWAPDGRAIATAGDDSLVKVWDATSGKLLSEFRGHTTGPVGDVRWLDGGKRLASRNFSETIRESETKIWDLNAEQRYRSISPASAITWTPSGTLVASTRNENGWTYDFVDPNTGSVTASFEDKEAASNVMCLSIDRAGRYLASSNTNGNLQVRDIGSGELLGAIKANARETRSIAWSPDGSMLATSGDDGFKVWNVENHEQIAHLIIGNHRPPEDGDSVIWSLDGRFLVGVRAREIRIWKTDDWREVTQIRTRDGGDNVVNGLSWSPTGDRFVSCTGQLIDIWNARSGRNLMEIKAHNTGIMSVAWSPDGSRIASGGRDHLIKIWDANTGEDMLTLRGHEKAVIQLAWSPDGRKLASSDGNSTRIWDATKGHLRP